MIRKLFNSGITIEEDKGIVFLFPDIQATVQLENNKQKLTSVSNQNLGYVLHHNNSYLNFVPINMITKENTINGYYTFIFNDRSGTTNIYNYFPYNKKNGVIQHIYIARSGYKGFNLTRSTYKEIKKINNFPTKINPDGIRSDSINSTPLTGSGKELTIYLLHSNNMYYKFRISFNNNTYIISNISYEHINYSIGTVNNIQSNNTLKINIEKPYILNMSEPTNLFYDSNSSPARAPSTLAPRPPAPAPAPAPAPSTPPPLTPAPRPPAPSTPLRVLPAPDPDPRSAYYLVGNIGIIKYNTLFRTLEQLKLLTKPIKINTYSYNLIKLLKNGYKFIDFYNSLVTEMRKLNFRDQIYNNISVNITYISNLMENEYIKMKDNLLQEYINKYSIAKELYYYNSAIILLEIVRLIKLINEDTLKKNEKLLEVINDKFTNILTNIDLTDKDIKTATVLNTKWKQVIIKLNTELSQETPQYAQPQQYARQQPPSQETQDYALPQEKHEHQYEVVRPLTGGSLNLQYYKFKSSELLNL